MKIYYKFLSALLVILMLQTTLTNAQEEKANAEQPPLIVVTTAHANFDYKEGSMKDWIALEKEYFDKVTSKNEYLMSTNVMMHMFTEDNSEVKFIRVCKDWETIEKAAMRDGELAKEAWPDNDERKAFFDKQSKYYTSMHSDEIYSAIEGAKFLDESVRDESHVYYVQVSHLSFPDDSKPGEVQELYKEYNQALIQSNSHILAYYPYTHLYGSDSRQFVQVYVVESLESVDLALNAMGDLAEAHWPDDDARKDFFERYNRFFTGWHADYIYQNVPELMK